MDLRAVRHVQEVYAVVLGVALVLGVEQLLDPSRAGHVFELHLVPGFLAFVSLAFSIYHWGVRYLDRKYMASRRQASRLSVYVDLIVGAFELLLLIALAILISEPLWLGVGIVCILGFEVLAGLSLRGAGGYDGFGSFPTVYLIINLAGSVSLALWLILDDFITTQNDALRISLVAMTICMARALIFYRYGFEILFGDPAEQRSVPDLNTRTGDDLV